MNKLIGREILSKLVDNDKSRHQPYTLENDNLKVIPAGKGIGWFSDSKGAFLYQKLTGNFMVETSVKVQKKNSINHDQRAQFSSAGLLIRNPESGAGTESWVMYNIGYQNSFYGREIKVTRPSNGLRFDPMYFIGYRSLSTLYLIPSKETGFARIRMARVGNQVRCYYCTADSWQEEKPVSEMEAMGNGLKYPVDQFNEQEFRPTNLLLPDKVQVGIISNPGMDTKRPWKKYRDSEMLFSDYAYKKINSFDECLED
ncbi:MAG: hypothetical protein UMU04_08375 [Halanaerobiales bacterium]|nr:hypothetical protein [Halanaerobiales bacterium]